MERKLACDECGSETFKREFRVRLVDISEEIEAALNFRFTLKARDKEAVGFPRYEYDKNTCPSMLALAFYSLNALPPFIFNDIGKHVGDCGACLRHSEFIKGEIERLAKWQYDKSVDVVMLSLVRGHDDPVYETGFPELVCISCGKLYKFSSLSGLMKYID